MKGEFATYFDVEMHEVAQQLPPFDVGINSAVP